MKFLGIYREHIFSPGRVDDDSAVLDATLHELRRRGHATAGVHGEDLERETRAGWCVLTMAQSSHALDILTMWSDRGMTVVNHPRSIRNCRRNTLFAILTRAGLPLPLLQVLTADSDPADIPFRRRLSYWVKRGGVHRIEPRDVVHVGNREGLKRTLDEFRSRSIRSVLLQEHVEGEVVKFYGVEDSHFFSAFLGDGVDDIGARLPGLKVMAAQAADAVGLEVYGGDAIVMPSGDTRLIDLNAWPSFARCRSAATRAIADHVEAISRADTRRISTEA